MKDWKQFLVTLCVLVAAVYMAVPKIMEDPCHALVWVAMGGFYLAFAFITYYILKWMEKGMEKK